MRLVAVDYVAVVQTALGPDVQTICTVKTERSRSAKKQGVAPLLLRRRAAALWFGAESLSRDDPQVFLRGAGIVAGLVLAGALLDVLSDVLLALRESVRRIRR